MNISQIKQKINTELTIQGKSPNTIKNYCRYNEDFLKFIKKQAEDVEEDDVKLYMAYLTKDRKNSLSSVQLALSAITFFYHKILKRPILTDITRPKKARKLPNVLTKAEVAKLLKACGNLRDKLAIEFMYASGLRVAECASLRVSDLDLEDKTGHLKHGKGGKDRLFLLSNTQIEDLKKYLEKHSSEYLFPGKDGHITTRRLQQIVVNFGKKAGIKKKVYCHLLRHAFATHLLESGVDIRKIQVLLAHSNLETTQFYTHVSTKGLKEIKSPLDMLEE